MGVEKPFVGRWLAAASVVTSVASACGGAPPPETATTEIDLGVAPVAAPSVAVIASSLAREQVPSPPVAPAPPPELDDNGDANPPSALLGASAPAFSGSRVGQSGQVDLASLRGRVVVVHFFATWVAPSKAALQALTRVQATAGASKVVIVAVSVDDASDGKAVATFVRGESAKTLFLHDATMAIAHAYAPSTMPMTYVIDKQGVLRSEHRGFSAGDEAALMTEVSGLAK